MAYDDDEQRAAYHRAVNNEFFNIVQHYDDTAHPDHDDIEYESPDYDGAEFDDKGNRVLPVSNFNDVLADILGIIAEFDSFEDVPDDMHIIEVDIPDEDPEFNPEKAERVVELFFDGPIFLRIFRNPEHE